MLFKEYITKIKMISELQNIPVVTIYDNIDNCIKNNNEDVVSVNYITDKYYVITQRDKLFACRRYELSAGGLVRHMVGVSGEFNNIKCSMINDVIVNHPLNGTKILNDENTKAVICKDIKDSFPGLSEKSIYESVKSILDNRVKIRVGG